MITTTLARIKAHGPCPEGWRTLLAHLGKTRADDEPLPYSVIVESNGLDDALWACRAEPEHAREWRLFAIWCARQVQGLMTDPRSLAALEVAERHAAGTATDEELDAARAAAWAAWAASNDTWAASNAAEAAARAAARAAAEAAAEAAAKAATDEELTVAKAAQRERFLLMVGVSPGATFRELK